METKLRYLKFVPQGGPRDWFDIHYFKNPGDKTPLCNGDITVPKGGAIITFFKMPGEVGWDFHDLTIHPMGSKTDRLDIRWLVLPHEITVLHQEAEIKRKYSYTLSLKVGSAYAYLDPQIVDTGEAGSPPFDPD